VDLSMMKRNIASIETIQSAFGEGVGEAEGEKHIGQPSYSPWSKQDTQLDGWPI
jgi:hypothetical protein